MVVPRFAELGVPAGLGVTSQLKIEQVKTEVKIRLTPELPTFLALQDRVLESIFLLCLPREAL